MKFNFPPAPMTYSSKVLIVGTLLLTGGLFPLVMAKEAVIAQTTVAQSDNRADVQKLKVGKVTPATIEGDQKQSYVIPMEKGQYLELIVEQKNVDVIVTLFDPQGQQVLEMDYTGRSGELVLAIAERTGNYRLQVRRFEHDILRGDYRVRLVALKAASQNEQEKVSAYRKAHKAFLEGIALLKTGKPESLPQVLEKLKEALSNYQAIEQPSIVGMVLINMGDVYIALKDYPRALESYQQALALIKGEESLLAKLLLYREWERSIFLKEIRKRQVIFCNRR
ncbi:MAG: hypothetical protein DCF12_07925 [Snowella sp.]|nr:MAG: hypothetical protein DCF12_07925 [Snowella sp.]